MLSVKTTHGKPFRRAGILFGPQPTVVSDEQLAEPFGKGTVRDALLAEPMLVCSEVQAPADTDPDPEKKKARGK